MTKRLHVMDWPGGQSRLGFLLRVRPHPRVSTWTVASLGPSVQLRLVFIARCK